MTQRTNKLAAIDIGTNSFHMVIAEPKRNGKFTVVGRDKESVRLGAGISDMKHLTKDAMQRALLTLKRFKMIADMHHAKIRAVATSAVREAINQEEFVRLVREVHGIDVEVISGFEEARLIYLGTLQALPIYRKKVLVIDIGGGSTECIIGERGKALYVNSLKIGAIRLTQRFFQRDQLRNQDVKLCRDFLEGVLFPVRRSLEKHNFELAVGTSGTIQSICSMIDASLGKDYSLNMNNIVFTKKNLAQVLERLLTEKTVQARAKIPGLDAARVDLIVAGALIVEQIFNQLDVTKMTYSGYALREGVLYDTIQKIQGGRREGEKHLSNIRYQSVLHLGELSGYDAHHARKVSALALEMFDQTKSIHRLTSDEREYLEAAALLHDVGYHISHAQHHRHSYYLIRNAEMLGFTDREIEIIANVARYHRKSHPKLKHESFVKLGDHDREIVRKLAAILRIAEGLDRTNKNVVSNVKCHLSGKKLTIHIFVRDQKDCSLEVWCAERRKELFELLYNMSIKFSVHHYENLHRL